VDRGRARQGEAALASNVPAMDPRSERWARRFDWVVLVAAALVIPVVAIEQSSPGDSLRTAATVANWAIWSVFLTEVVFMLAIVPDRWRWLRANPLDVAIVVLTPPSCPHPFGRSVSSACSACSA
jgi:hypothetical protein